MDNVFIQEDMDPRSSDIRTAIIKKLGEDGFATYAERLKEFKFLVADAYKGQHVPTAAMFSDGTIVFSPNWFIDGIEDKKTLDQLSLLVRHEMLHYLLAHIIRMKEYLQKKFPKLKFTDDQIDLSELTPEDRIEFGAYHAADNIAADFDLSQKYDNYDKEVVRNMTLCGEVIGGLIMEDQHPEWMGLKYEEILEKVTEEKRKEIKQAAQWMEDHPQMEIHIEEENHSAEYVDIYNKIIDKYDDDKYSDEDLEKIIEKAIKDGEIDID